MQRALLPTQQRTPSLVTGIDAHGLNTEIGALENASIFLLRVSCILSGLPELKRGPRQPSGDNHQTVGKENERRVSGLCFAKEFDNPTRSFLAIGLARAPRGLWFVRRQVKKGRFSLGVLAFTIASAAANLAFAVIWIIQEM
ncbi:hypothetical protein DXU04_35015 [Bradyrhizobium diazoefficiens]|nr:hypothetical protein BD122_26345 [Bradyrhizobium diazoefficiens]KOY10850.1 hypothetical protein AF336_07825 [Bradyrhizobium diazoefficiens]